jgi:hypothetical protein
MMRIKRLLTHLCTGTLLISCASATPPALAGEIITIYSTPAAEPWLYESFTCANHLGIVLNVTAQGPHISLRIGEPDTLAQPAFQIDEEEILIVTHRESPIQNLSLEGAQTLFAGQGDPSAQVWVYASDTDVQRAFDGLVMNGRNVASTARLATSPQHMSDTLNVESNAVGILSRHWRMGDTREVFSAGTVPVLAITLVEPVGAVAGLIACLQGN